MRALILKISFFEAFFKVHYTRFSRLTYPVPLPTTVAGMFGSMLGLSRRDVAKEFSHCLFGATAVGSIRRSAENATYILYEHRRKGVDTMHILVDPTYYIVVGGPQDKIDEWNQKISDSIVFFPFGGQNDFFAKDWETVSITNLEELNEVSNYVPISWVTEVPSGIEIEILPVMHKLSDDANFLFVLKGSVKIKRTVPIARINNHMIALYELDGFYKVGEWA